MKYQAVSTVRIHRVLRASQANLETLDQLFERQEEE
jgi:hypothetical protein